MKLKTINFSSKQLNKSIPKYLLNLVENTNNNNLRIIPTLHWEIIKNNLFNNEKYSKYNNEKDFFHIIDTLLFIINYNFQSSKRMEKEIDRYYKKYINILKNFGIIIHKENFDRKNKKCNRYFTCDVDDRFTIITKDSKFKNKDDDKVNEKLDEYEQFTLENAKINIPLAITRNHLKIRNTENYSLRMSMRLSSISRFIHNKRYVKKSIKCGRLYTSFTELSSETRKSVYIKIDGENYYFNEIDMSNAAPCLLTNRLLRDEGLNGQMLKDAGDGRFYESLHNEIKKSGEINNKWYNFKDDEYLYYNERNSIKKMVCASILYGEQPNKILLQAFYNLYPTEALIINHIKEEEGKDFANNNMKEESKIFLNLNVPVYKFTTHDAIYFLDKDNEKLFRKAIDKRMKYNFGEKVKYDLKVNYNNSDEYDVQINNFKGKFNIFLITPKKRKEHKQHKQHKQRTKNIDKVKNLIDSGITKNMELVKETGLSLSTIKRIKKSI